MQFVPPAVLLLFGAAFLALWVLEKKLVFALSLAAGFWLLALAMLAQVASVPAAPGYNTLVAGLFYTGGLLMVAKGVLERSQRRLPAFLSVLYLAGIVGGLWYCFFIDHNLIARIYVLNFGMGLILLNTCWLARFLAVGTNTDRALFWLLAAFGIHFLPRTLLTINSVAPATQPADFEQSTFWQTVLLTTPIFSAIGGLCLLGIFVVDIVTKLRRERDLDPLTGVLNRRGLERVAARPRPTRIVAVCDIDKFKSINDTYGHHAGDTVLEAFADVIRRNLRKDDIVARVGGEEFVLILDDMGQDEAFAFTERLREALAEAGVKGLGTAEHVTCSFGLAKSHPGETFWASLERADKALYMAKRGGRNRTCAEWHAEAA